MDNFIMQIIGELGRHPDVIRHAITASNEEKHFPPNPSQSSQNNTAGGGGDSDLRTCFGVSFIVGMALARYRLASFVVEPFYFAWRSGGLGDDCRTDGEGCAFSVRHPICRVLEWRERLRGDEGLTKRQISEEEGVSKARITQMFSLLRLPWEAQKYLASLTLPALIKSFTIRRLMSVAKLPPARQAEAFEEMKAGAERRAG